MKKTLCAIAVVGSLLSVSAFAANKPGTASLVHSQGPQKGHFPSGAAALTPPAVCAPVCLFYGGDTNTSASTDNGFANENTLLVPDTTVWGAFTIPAGQTWWIEGLFINTISDGYNGLDPAESTWTIASGVSEGNAGTVIATGTSTAGGTQYIPTGRLPFGFNEYSLRVRTTETVLTAGTYYVNITPQCTNSGNGSCPIAQYFWDDTFGLNRYGPLEPAGVGFFNSSYFGFNYANLCEVSSTGCEALSFGVIGWGH